MNWQHLQTFAWLRWRMLVNQWRRGGAFNAWLMIIVSACLLALAVPLGIGCVIGGYFAFPKATPEKLLYAWDAMVVGFMFFWCIGLMTELQRTETLTLSKFLHLPVSINSAFLINYLSSLVNLSLIIFVPVLFGFAIALVLVKGWMSLVVLPATAAFLLMVTALTYQFQGWLASLMSNPRRRRTVVMVSTMAFILLFQLPNLLNFVRPWGMSERAKQTAKLLEEMKALERAHQANELNISEYAARQQEVLDKYEQAKNQEVSRSFEHWKQIAQIANLALPIGWLPIGVMSAAEGTIWPALLGCLGMTFIGSASLWRSYRTTLKLYQGGFTASKPTTPVATSVASTVTLSPTSGARKSKSVFLETRLPWISEPASVIALAGLRSIVRSPEGKMMLLTPLFMGLIFGSSLWKWPHAISDTARPFLGVGAMLFAMFGMVQLTANQFGFDRNGFRVFVLCAARRRDILLGKNLAGAPLVLGTAAIMVTILQFVCPMRIVHLLAMVPQFISMFLLFCMLMNFLSIYAPMPIAAGSLKPANPKVIPMLIQMAMFMIFFPLIQLPTLLPFGVEAQLLEWQGWGTGLPVSLLIAIVECAAVVVCYHHCLNWEGNLLQAREQKILETVTNRAA